MSRYQGSMALNRHVVQYPLSRTKIKLVYEVVVDVVDVVCLKLVSDYKLNIGFLVSYYLHIQVSSVVKSCDGYCLIGYGRCFRSGDIYYSRYLYFIDGVLD